MEELSNTYLVGGKKQINKKNLPLLFQLNTVFFFHTSPNLNQITKHKQYILYKNLSICRINFAVKSNVPILSV